MTKPYHSSAVLAAAIDTATLPIRSRQFDMTHVSEGLSIVTGAKIFALACSLPFDDPSDPALQQLTMQPVSGMVSAERAAVRAAGP
jgi:hypothetical protein